MINKRMVLIYYIMPFLLNFVLTGCTSTSSPKETSIQIANAVEVMGINWSKYQGRILRIESKGNESTDADTVRENALIRATWEINKLGFDYFVILSENGKATHSTYTTSGSAITMGTYTYINPGQTYNVTSHTLTIIVLGCSKNELMNDVPAFSVSSRLEQAQHYFNIDEGQNKEQIETNPTVRNRR